MPCKCVTGCINKKCSCRAKGEFCTESCMYCFKKDHDCYNLPGSDKALALKKDTKEKEKEKPQTVIINNYYSHTEYKQQNTATQIVHNYNENGSSTSTNNVNKNNNGNNLKGIPFNDNNVETTSNPNANRNNNTTNNNNTASMNISQTQTPQSNVQDINIRLTTELAKDFLIFYWECLSSKEKIVQLTKYLFDSAEFSIQGTIYQGSVPITDRLRKAAPIKIDSIEHLIIPYNLSLPSNNNTNLTNEQSTELISSSQQIQYLGKIETQGIMKDLNDNSAHFKQSFNMIYHKTLNLVQVQFSELFWT